MKTIAIHDLGDRLIADLRADYPSGATLGNASAQALRDRLAKFGAEAGRSGVRLEEAMSAAIAALQDLFDRTGGQGGDPATALAAGTALAALAASFHEAEKSATGTEPNVGDAPFAMARRAPPYQSLGNRRSQPFGPAENSRPGACRHDRRRRVQHHAL